MKRFPARTTAAFLAISFAITAAGCADGERGTAATGTVEAWPSPAGGYLGMDAPPEEAGLFAPGILTHGFHEISMSFSPGLDEFFLITSDRAYSFYVVIHSRLEAGVWSEPAVAPFSGRYRDASVSFRPDGSGVIISSDRPSAHRFGLWSVERSGEGWEEPEALGSRIPGFEGGSCAVQAASGDIYYQSLDNDIYFAEWKEGAYQPPARIPEPVSTADHEGRPFIAPDGSYLIFNSNRAGGFGESDLYVCFAGDGGWGEPVNLGARVNSPSGDFSASVTADGKCIFFSSYRSYGPEKYQGKSYREIVSLFSSPQNGYAALYWVDASILDSLREDN